MPRGRVRRRAIEGAGPSSGQGLGLRALSPGRARSLTPRFLQPQPAKRTRLRAVRGRERTGELVDDEGRAPAADEQPPDRPHDDDSGAPPFTPFGASTATSIDEADDHWDGASTHLGLLGQSSTNPAIFPFLQSTVDAVLVP